MSMTVSEVEASTGVPANTVRWYLRRRLLRPRRNLRNGYYQFSAADLRALSFIRRAKALGFTLREIATIFETSRRKESPCPMVRDIVQRRIVDVDGKLEDLAAIAKRMRQALKLWRRMPDGVPRGDEVCHLIESLGQNVDLRATRGFTMRTRI